MNYILTGGAGFIGSHLASFLINQGHRIEIIDNLSAGSLSNVENIKEKITFHKLDILHYNELEKIIEGKDGIFHHAALTSVPESYVKQKEYNDVNVIGTENIFKIANKLHIKTVFASSSSVYGNTKTIPTPESEKRDPISPYGITKLAAENLATNYSNNCDIVGLRYYNVYGEGMISSGKGVISQFYQNIQNKRAPVIDGDGEQLRDFVFVGDVVQATISAMEKKTGSCFVNIGSGNTISIRHLANLFIKYSELDLKPVFEQEKEGNIKTSQADITLAKRLLDWQPQTKLEDWIKNLYK